MYLTSAEPNPYVMMPALSTVRACGGLGCVDCGGKCGGGLGLFDSGWDVAGWSWPEYSLVGLGVYMLVSSLFATSRGVRYVAGSGERRRKRRVAKIRQQLKDLEGKGTKKK